MFGKDIDDEQLCQVTQSNGIFCWNEYSLFEESINDNENCVKTRCKRQFFNEIYKY